MAAIVPAVEAFLLNEAVEARVVKKVTITNPTNPNRVHKHMAP